MTAVRVGLGAAATVAAFDGTLHAAATLITMGAVTDGLDGHFARRLRTASSVGALFDYFADFLCFVIAPWALSRALLTGALDPARELLLGLPLVTGALRYAQNGAVVSRQELLPIDLPGVGTVFYAFVPVVVVFLDLAQVAGLSTLAAALPVTTAAFSCLMLAPIRYPKLARFAGASPTVLALLLCMPFVQTKLIATAALLLGLLFIAFGPFLSRIPSARGRP